MKKKLRKLLYKFFIWYFQPHVHFEHGRESGRSKVLISFYGYNKPQFIYYDPSVEVADAVPLSRDVFN